MNIDTEMTVGQRFKHYRIQKGLSQNELCEGICSYSTISHLENDRSIPSPKIMGQLADRLGVSLSVIMGKQEKQTDINFQIELLDVYIAKRDCPNALDLIETLEVRGELLEYQRVKLVVGRAKCHLMGKLYEQAVELVRSFLDRHQVQQTVDDETLCDLYNVLGYAFFMLRDFERAFSAYEYGYRVSLKLQEFGVVAATLTKNLGLVCNQLNLFDDARKYLEKAQEFFGSVSDVKSLADTIFALGMATNNAVHISKAKSLYESANLVIEANIVKQHYAYIIEAQEDYSNAVQSFRSAAEEFEKYGEAFRSLYTLSRAASVCLDNNDLKEAERLLVDAKRLKDRHEIEDEFALSIYYIETARFNLMRNLYDECRAYSQKSSDYYAKMGMYLESADALQLVAEAYQQEGDFQKACEVFRRVSDLLRKSQRGKN